MTRLVNNHFVKLFQYFIHIVFGRMLVTDTSMSSNAFEICYRCHKISSQLYINTNQPRVHCHMEEPCWQLRQWSTWSGSFQGSGCGFQFSSTVVDTEILSSGECCLKNLKSNIIYLNYHNKSNDCHYIQINQNYIFLPIYTKIRFPNKIIPLCYKSDKVTVWSFGQLWTEVDNYYHRPYWM